MREIQVEKCRRDLMYREREIDIERERKKEKRRKDNKKSTWQKKLLKEVLLGPCWFFFRWKTLFGHVELFRPEITTFWVMLNYFPWKNNFWGHVEFFPRKKHFFQKCASFCWNVEYVRSCWMPFSEKKCFFLLKCWICWICWIIFASIWSLLAFHRPEIIQHIQHIQHFSRKKHIFSKIGSNMIQHIQHFNRKKHIWYTCWSISPEITTFGAMFALFPPKQPLFGPCWIFPQKEAFFQKCASFCWKCWIC